MNNIDTKQLTAIEIKLDHLTTNLFRLQKSVDANNVYESGHLYLTDVIDDKYKYYSGFSYNKDLTALAKLNYLTDIFFDKRDDAECQKLDQQYNDALLDNWVTDEENEVLKEERDWYKLALEKICKRQGLRPAPSLEECKYIASNALDLYNKDTVEPDQYKEALEEITKRPRKAETCKLIAKKALGLLSDDNYQPELLIEENLKLKIENENLTSTLIEKALTEIYSWDKSNYNASHKLNDLQARFNVCEGLKQQYYNQLCENGLAEYGN